MKKTIIALLCVAGSLFCSSGFSPIQEVTAPELKETPAAVVDLAAEPSPAIEPEATEAPAAENTPAPASTPEPVQAEPLAAETGTKTSTDAGELVSLGTFCLTAYCSCPKCCGSYANNRPLDENGEQIVYTATGTRATAGRTLAVDPTVIPYGTEVIINGHTYVAEDCGGGVKGYHIDVYYDSHEAAWAQGVLYEEVFILTN